MDLLLFADVFVQCAATSAVFLLVLPTSQYCFPPIFTLSLGLATSRKIIKIYFARLHLPRSVMSRLFKPQVHPSDFPSLKEGEHEQTASQGEKLVS